MQNELLQTRRDGTPGPSMTLKQINDLPDNELDGLEVRFNGGWIRPAKWRGDGDDIEVVL